METELTPMMSQYLSVKKNYQDSILLFRLGDFYEMFFDDAEKASRLLELTLTSRNKNQKDSVPLCGIPVHAAQGYINKLVTQGHKVAICEQVEDPKKAKGIVRREVVSVFTPGVLTDPNCLQGKSHNYLLCLSHHQDRWGLARADVSTGSLKVMEFFEGDKLTDEILRCEPSEIIFEESPSNQTIVESLKKNLSRVRFHAPAGWNFDGDYARDRIHRYYHLDETALGLSTHPAALRACGALLTYLDESKLLKDNVLERPEFLLFYDSMVLDEITKKNLELLKTLGDQNSYGSLLWHLDRAETSMGSRKLKDWLLYPLLDVKTISSRHDALDELSSAPDLLAQFKRCLSLVSDMERIQNRVLLEQATARDLVALRCSLEIIPEIKEALTNCRCELLRKTGQGLLPLESLTQEISKTLVDDPPLGLTEGGLIRQGVHGELDDLRNIESNGKSTIAALEAKERQRTGISSLKIRFNQVFGYYIEVTHTHKDKVPSDYIRKQTLTNAERYITPELKEYEDRVLGASERIKGLEYDLFLALRKRAAQWAKEIKNNASHLGALDALCSLAQVARNGNYIRPQMTEEPILSIEGGRHPLVEALHPEEPFIPNDVVLGTPQCKLMLITGPNMAGKSTVMRQVALISLMAQMGGFVPATKATLGITDRIFTRIGASDSLQKGQSTFMVEMLETAHILQQATKKSLILLDEIGRGTSTFDGLSIAWAVAETIHNRIGARTLFATHYHELTDLEQSLEGVCNYHMAIKEWNGDIRFLRELKKGGTNRSYGVHVAAMAGLPDKTILRAREILRLLEEKEMEFSQETKTSSAQPSLFSDMNRPVIETLKSASLNEMTPIQAMSLLAQLQKEIV